MKIQKNHHNPIKPRKWGWGILFFSTGTLICCALPILLVSLGMGALVASLFSTVPFLVTLTHYKTWMFAASGLLLLLGGWLLYRPHRACPSDPELAKLCASADRWNTRLLWVAAVIWCIGFFTAYMLLPLYLWFGF